MALFLIGLYAVASTVSSLGAELTSVIPPATINIDISKENDTLKLDNKSLHFVDQIKNNLRKNNDDYVVLDLPNPKPSYEGETRRRLNDTGKIPVLDASPHKPAAKTNTTIFRSVLLDQIRDYNHDQHKVARAVKEKHVTHKEVAPAHNAPINDEDRKARVDSWKRILEKNKRLRMYTSTAKIEPTPSVRHRLIQDTKTTKSHTRQMEISTASCETTRIEKKDKLRARPLHAILKVRPTQKGRAPPNADQLDMAPARGAHIHDLRVKGWFCHRNVLWPEGPKYNSKGNTIMPEFNFKVYSKAGKSFVDTTRALFVLPRCCNCCRKSVLGCQ